MTIIPESAGTLKFIITQIVEVGAYLFEVIACLNIGNIKYNALKWFINTNWKAVHGHLFFTKAVLI